MLGVIFLEFVVGGARLFSRHTFFLLFQELLSVMWREMVLYLILWSGLLMLFRRDVGWCMLWRDRAFLSGPAGIWEGE